CKRYCTTGKLGQHKQRLHSRGKRDGRSGRRGQRAVRGFGEADRVLDGWRRRLLELASRKRSQRRAAFVVHQMAVASPSSSRSIWRTGGPHTAGRDKLQSSFAVAEFTNRSTDRSVQSAPQQRKVRQQRDDVSASTGQPRWQPLASVR